jgi:hypothetical protein
LGDARVQRDVVVSDGNSDGYGDSYGYGDPDGHSYGGSAGGAGGGVQLVADESVGCAAASGF